MISMIKKISNKIKVKEIVSMRDYIVDNYMEFSQEWLKEDEKILVSAENVAHPVLDEARSLSNALVGASCQNSEIFAITCESGFLDDELDVYSLDGSYEDLMEFSIVFSPFNFLLFPSNLKAAVLLLYTHDVKFLAGDQAFIDAYGGTRYDLRIKFKDFVNSQQKIAPDVVDYISNLRWAYLKMGIDDLDDYPYD